MKYSIIITAYNSAKYIKKCLDSIVNQTVQNFKVLVIDDGSTDNTKEVISSYQRKYDNIEYYHKQNGGVSDARNYGASKVETPYFLYVDSDDYVPIDLIETIDEYSDYDLLSFKGIKVDENGKFLEKLEKESFNLLDGRSYLKSLLRNNSFFLVPWGYVYKTKFWKKHKFEYSRDYVLEDTSLTPIVIMNADNLVSIDYYGYYYVQTNESITRTKSVEKIKFNTKCALYHYDYLINYVENRDYDESFKTLFFHFFAHYLLWYGANLPDNHLKDYVKELRKRDVANRLRNLYISDKRDRALCNFSYRLYMFKSKHFKWKMESLYFKYKRIITEIFHNFFAFIFWKIIHPIYWIIYKIAIKFYWKVLHKIGIVLNNIGRFIYFNILNKPYWIIRKTCSFIYWKIIREIWINILRFFACIIKFILNIIKKLFWLTRNGIIKLFWMIHGLSSKIYWKSRDIILKLANFIYWNAKGFITTISIKIYWAFKNSWNFIYWKIIHKIYWKIRGFGSFIYRKLFKKK